MTALHLISGKLLLWLAFGFLVFTLLYVDLRVFNRHARVITLKHAAIWSAVWVMVSLLFNTGIYMFMGPQKAMEFLTGYILEKSLSVDNLFVFIMIFSYFNIPQKYQPRILHWGILGALVMRLVLICTGVALIHAFEWVIYVFGAVLIYTGIKMAVEKEQKIEPGKNPVLRLFKKFVPVKDDYDGERFFVKHNLIWHATSLFAVLLVIEVSDLIFAIDSIPAVLAITTDTFIVYTSNVFAILGLRALYFLLAGVIGLFRFLKFGISLVLVYTGVKMLLVDVYKIPVVFSLCVVTFTLSVSVIASVVFKEKKEQAGELL